MKKNKIFKCLTFFTLILSYNVGVETKNSKVFEEIKNQIKENEKDVALVNKMQQKFLGQLQKKNSWNFSEEKLQKYNINAEENTENSEEDTEDFLLTLGINKIIEQLNKRKILETHINHGKFYDIINYCNCTKKEYLYVKFYKKKKKLSTQISEKLFSICQKLAGPCEDLNEITKEKLKSLNSTKDKITKLEEEFKNMAIKKNQKISSLRKKLITTSKKNAFCCTTNFLSLIKEKMKCNNGDKEEEEEYILDLAIQLIKIRKEIKQLNNDLVKMANINEIPEEKLNKKISEIEENGDSLHNKIEKLLKSYLNEEEKETKVYSMDNGGVECGCIREEEYGDLFYSVSGAMNDYKNEMKALGEYATGKKKEIIMDFWLFKKELIEILIFLVPCIDNLSEKIQNNNKTDSEKKELFNNIIEEFKQLLSRRILKDKYFCQLLYQVFFFMGDTELSPFRRNVKSYMLEILFKGQTRESPSVKKVNAKYKAIQRVNVVQKMDERSRDLYEFSSNSKIDDDLYEFSSNSKIDDNLSYLNTFCATFFRKISANKGFSYQNYRITKELKDMQYIIKNTIDDPMIKKLNEILKELCIKMKDVEVFMNKKEEEKKDPAMNKQEEQKQYPTKKEEEKKDPTMNKKEEQKQNPAMNKKEEEKKDTFIDKQKNKRHKNLKRKKKTTLIVVNQYKENNTQKRQRKY